MTEYLCRFAIPITETQSGAPGASCKIMMYLRFITPETDERSGRRQGVFTAAFDLVDGNSLARHELNELQELLDWFSANLKKPQRLSKSGRKETQEIAICWYKDSATECVSRMRAMCSILNEHGITTSVVISAKPGYIVCEDQLQIAAIPFTETGA